MQEQIACRGGSLAPSGVECALMSLSAVPAMVGPILPRCVETFRTGPLRYPAEAGLHFGLIVESGFSRIVEYGFSRIACRSLLATRVYYGWRDE